MTREPGDDDEEDWLTPPPPEPRVCRDCGRTIDTGGQDDCRCVDEDEDD